MSCGLARPGFSLDVQMAVADDEMVLLSGPNGSGKTTLLHLVAGLLAVDRGEIALGDRTIDRAGPRGDAVFVQPEERHVGLLPQGGALFPHLTALENVAFGPRARGLSRDRARATALDRLEQFGIAHLAGRRPHELSGGQRQRVAIARTLAVEPTVLLLDEPTTALDAASRRDVATMLTELGTSFGGPIILVSHDEPGDPGRTLHRVHLEPLGGTEISVEVHLGFTHGLGGR